jgi:hypothetical protein
MKRTISVVMVAVFAMLGLATPAVASHQTIPDSQLVQGAWVPYEKARHVNKSGSHVFVKKTDGPTIGIKWRRCGGGGQGGEVILPNNDPTERKVIGTNFAAGTCFKLSAKSYGENARDTWRGEIWWNVYS